LRDALEALAIGRALGEQVIVVGTSTGGTLALWLAQQPEAKAIAALLLVSPNLGPRNRQGELLAGPWGAQLLTLLVGDTYAWQPANAQQERYWTWKYPSRALLPMMALVREVRESDLARIRIPTQIIYSPEDNVVHPAQIEAAFARLGATMKSLEPLADAQDRSRHVLAGDILAPRDTSRVLARMQQFLESASIRAQTRGLSLSQ
jgi:alpha-beta hydrolase superfamily lysophospholipase